MDEPDYYQILQVDPKAEPEVIQAAYRRLAAKYHPDVNKTAPEDAERRMKELNKAYSVLSDPAMRAEYDATYRRSGGGQRREPRARPTRPQFEIRPPRIEINGVDPSRPVVFPEIQLVQTGGDPFDPELDWIDFTLKPSSDGAFLNGIEFLSTASPFLVRLTLDLGYTRHRPGWYFIGTINVRGDPAAASVLVVKLQESTGSVFDPNPREARDPQPAARERPEAGYEEPVTRRRWAVSRFWSWLVQPLSAAPDKPMRWPGATARLATVLGLAATGWIIATNLVPIFVFFVGLLCVLTVLVALVFGDSQPAPRRARPAKRRRR